MHFFWFLPLVFSQLYTCYYEKILLSCVIAAVLEHEINKGLKCKKTHSIMLGSDWAGLVRHFITLHQTGLSA